MNKKGQVDNELEPEMLRCTRAQRHRRTRRVHGAASDSEELEFACSLSLVYRKQNRVKDINHFTEKTYKCLLSF